MRCAPEPNDDEIGTREDNAVADPLADSTLELWNRTARTNREIFTEVFRPVPTNLVRSWSAYEASNDVYEFSRSMSDGHYAELFAKG
jgi:phospholipase D1/2